MIRSMPILHVSDVAASAAWWQDALGFEAGTLFGDPPAFCIVARETVTIALQRLTPCPQPPEHHWSAYVYLASTDAYHAELLGRGVAIARPPEDTFYGCRELDVRTPDGHLICFGQDLDPRPPGPGLG